MDWGLETNYSGSVRNKGKNFGGGNRLPGGSLRKASSREKAVSRAKASSRENTSRSKRASPRKSSRGQRFPKRRGLIDLDGDEDCVVLYSACDSSGDIKTKIFEVHKKLTSFEMAQRENFRQLAKTEQEKKLLSARFAKLSDENDHISEVKGGLMKGWDWEKGRAYTDDVQKAVVHNDQRAMENRYYWNEILDRFQELDLYRSKLLIFGEHLRKSISETQNELTKLWSHL